MTSHTSPSDAPSDASSDATERPRRARTRQVALLVLGLALLALVVATQDLDQVQQAWRSIGWNVFWLAPVYAAGLVLATLAWRLLFVPGTAPSHTVLYAANWVGYSANQLLPVAHIGGDLIKARLIAGPRLESSYALATSIADKTVAAATLIPYAIIGCLALLAKNATRELMWPSIATLAVLGGLIYGFYRLQQHGLASRTSQFAARLVPSARSEGLVLETRAVDDALRRCYADKRRLVWSLAMATGFRITLAAEVWLTLYWMGHPVGWLDAIMLESVNQLVRAATFLLPGAYGAQEAGLIGIGTAIGIPAPASLTVSLAKRGRELITGVPTVFVWLALRARRTAAETDTRCEPGQETGPA